MQDDLLYQIALTLVPNIGYANTKKLVSHFGNASSVFKASLKYLESIEGMGSVRANSIKKFHDFERAEEEIRFIEKYRITPLFLTDKDYPKRLLHCYDSPSLLYFCGNADLNAPKIISIVGTRTCSEYGKALCEELITSLRDEGVLIVSGLAFGIDTIAHRICLKNNLPTVAVLAHGLDRIYPSQNTSLAKQMINEGGLLTDFMSFTKPDRQNFPDRNRIVAGMCDAVVVIESAVKGGSLITAELANSYNKDVFAFPGRIHDLKSAGCNDLIKKNKAALIASADDLIENMGWKKKTVKASREQRRLFMELSPEQQAVVSILQSCEQVHIDELRLKSELSSSSIAQALLTLEMEGIIVSLPGKMYTML